MDKKDEIKTLLEGMNYSELMEVQLEIDQAHEDWLSRHRIERSKAFKVGDWVRKASTYGSETHCIGVVEEITEKGRIKVSILHLCDGVTYLQRAQVKNDQYTYFEPSELVLAPDAYESIPILTHKVTTQIKTQARKLFDRRKEILNEGK